MLDAVDGLTQIDHFLGLFEEADLVVAGDKVGEADQADEDAAFVGLAEEFAERVGG